MCSKCKTGRGPDVILGPKQRAKAAPKPALNHKEARIAAFKAAQRKAGTLSADKPVKPSQRLSEPRKATPAVPVPVRKATRKRVELAPRFSEPVYDASKANGIHKHD